MARRGITLLEVLISMGVIAVGVLGAATMLPMATYFQSQTTSYDRGGALAQKAIHDLEIKSYLSPRRWIFVNPASGAVAGIGDLSLTGPAARSVFVIDPLGWANAAQQTPAVTFPSYFPAFPPSVGGNPPGGGPYIYRAGITANDYWPSAATMPVAAPIPMTYSVADRMMHSTDDVLFEYDPDALLNMKSTIAGQRVVDVDSRPMALNYLTDNLTPGSIVAPGTLTASAGSVNYAGEYSWIATVSRVPSDMTLGIAAANLHRFQATVVVLQSRNLTLWTGAGGITAEEPPPERQVYALFTQFGGQSNTSTIPFYGGGGLQLYVYEGAAPAAGTPSRHWLDNIKPNTYLMLTSWFQTYTDPKDTTPGAPFPKLAWYRILNVDDGPKQDPSNAARWYRSVTVAGADWPAMYYLWTTGSGAPLSGTPIQLWYGADVGAPNTLMPFSTGTAPLDANGNSTAPVCFCTLMDNSIASYDAVITLDNSLIHE